MPLADVGKIVARRVQQFAKRNQFRPGATRGLGVIVAYGQVLMRPAAVEQAIARRRTERNGRKGVGESHALASEPVDVRRAQETVAVGPDAVVAMLVGMDQQQVGHNGAFQTAMNIPLASSSSGRRKTRVTGSNCGCADANASATAVVSLRVSVHTE